MFIHHLPLPRTESNLRVNINNCHLETKNCNNLLRVQTAFSKLGDKGSVPSSPKLARRISLDTDVDVDVDVDVDKNTSRHSIRFTTLQLAGDVTASGHTYRAVAVVNGIC